MLAKIIISTKDAAFLEKCVKQLNIKIFEISEVDEKNTQIVIEDNNPANFFWIGVWYATKDKNRDFLIKSIKATIHKKSNSINTVALTKVAIYIRSVQI